jgi:hypothetical protein
MPELGLVSQSIASHVIFRNPDLSDDSNFVHIVSVFLNNIIFKHYSAARFLKHIFHGNKL